MKHLGDITKIKGDAIEAVDVIIGGSPCQDLSCAGKRAGLNGERSGLFMEQIRIVKEMRANEIRNGRTGEYVRPRYMVWENVPGSFSSNGGKDFQAVLTEIVRVADPEAPDVPMPDAKGGWTKSGCLFSDVGEWSVAWRVHDAQFWGVPQRRKRIALVADFGGLSAPEVLFERKGLSRNSEQSEQPGQGVAGASVSSLESANRERERERERRSCAVDVYNQRIDGDVSSTITAATGGTNTSGGKVLQEREEPIGINGDISGTLDSHYYLGCGARGGKEREVVAQPVLLESNQNHATIRTDGISTALPAAMGEGGGYIPMITDKSSYGTTQDGMTIAQLREGRSEVTPTLCAAIVKQTGNQNDEFIVAQEMKLPPL